MIKGRMHHIREGHKNYEKVKSSLKTATEDQILDLIDLKTVLAKMNKNADIKFKDGFIYADGKLVSSALAERYLQMVTEGFPVESYEKFIKNVYKNPSEESVKDLYTFLEACSLPITEDGCFLAYKRIRSDWTDCHTGKISNKIGTVVKMPRKDVDSNRNQTCSHGLHVCSLSYLKDFSGDRTVVVKVNPRDVVSVPTDYRAAKMRCCQYEVMEELRKDEKIPDLVAKVNEEEEIDDDDSVDTALVDMAVPEDLEAILAKVDVGKKSAILSAINGITKYASERHIPEKFYDDLPALDRRNLYRCAERIAHKGTKTKSSIPELREAKTLTGLKNKTAEYLARKK